MNMIIAYYKFKYVPNTDLEQSLFKTRYECVEYSALDRGLFLFKENEKNIYIDMYDYNDEYEYCLESPSNFFITANGFLFTAYYIENDGIYEYCYAYPNLTSHVSDIISSEIKNNGYLLIFHQPSNQLEIIVFEGCKGFMNCIYTLYSYGFYNEDLWLLNGYND